jgi:DNA gyrase subunit A
MADEKLTGNLQTIDITREMQQSYLEYSMSVITGRALPDVRDGMKPVHRRTLFAMYDSGNTHDKSYRKSARTVGEVIGKYHPHGDSAVYDTLVRMAQPFSLNAPCVDGQGNFGSQDGDVCAAMRYTEARMSLYGETLLEDVYEGTVDMDPNYDESLVEPSVLPSRAPNLLINGSQGIAVGMATSIPPHNLREVCTAALALMDNPQLPMDKLIEIIPAPDFPTGGDLVNLETVRAAYKSGRGKCIIRAKAHFEDLKGGRKAIVFTQLPYQVTMSSQVAKMAALVNEKKIDSISDIRDESDKDGVRVVVDLKRGELPEVVLNQLYQMTDLQSTFSVHFLVISQGVPRTKNLRDLLIEWIHHRYEVVGRRSQFRLDKAQNQLEIAEGLRKALDQIDLVVAIVRGSKTSAIAKAELISKLGLSETQAQAIMDMRLRKLTGLESDELDAEIQTLTTNIQKLNLILTDQSELIRVVKEETQEIMDRFGRERKSTVVGSVDKVTKKDLIADEQVIVSLTTSGYIKRTDVEAYRKQKRGGKGKIGAGMKDEDEIKFVVPTMTHDLVMVFTNLGKVFALDALDIPEAGSTGRGKHLRNLVDLSPDEDVVTLLPLRGEVKGDLVFVTSKGLVKRTEVDSYKNIRSSGLVAIKIDLGDHLVKVVHAEKDSPLFLQTKKGMCIQFGTETIRQSGRQSMGVSGIRFKHKDDEVIDAEIINTEDPQILLITELGLGKRVDRESFRVQGRGGSGLVSYKTDKAGDVIALLQVQEGDELVIFTKSGQSIRVSSDSIKETTRAAKGVKVMDLTDEDVIASVGVVREV